MMKLLTPLLVLFLLTSGSAFAHNPAVHENQKHNDPHQKYYMHHSCRTCYKDDGDSHYHYDGHHHDKDLGHGTDHHYDNDCKSGGCSDHHDGHSNWHGHSHDHDHGHHDGHGHSHGH